VALGGSYDALLRDEERLFGSDDLHTAATRENIAQLSKIRDPAQEA